MTIYLFDIVVLIMHGFESLFTSLYSFYNEFTVINAQISHFQSISQCALNLIWLTIMCAAVGTAHV